MNNKWEIQLKSDEEQAAEAARQMKFIEEAGKIVASISESIGRPLISNICTFGCQMYFKCKIINSCTAGGSFIHCT